MRDQVLRPWFLMHIVFAGYNFLTSVFYWFDLHGWTFGLAHSVPAGETRIALAAEVQRLFALGHAGLICGYALARPARVVVPRDQVRHQDPAAIVGWLAILSYSAVVICGFVPGLKQFAVKGTGVATVAAAAGLGLAVRVRSPWTPWFLGMNVLLFVSGFASGWKEAVFVLLFLNAASFYPRAPKTTAIAFSAGVLIAFVILPSISTSVRNYVWSGDENARRGLELAISDIRQKSSVELKEDTWTFLTSRLSEASMFSQYVADVPAQHPYYRLQLLRQAALTLVPRVFWPEKPDIEKLVMLRPVQHGIVPEEESAWVSTKPPFLADAYLSGGAIAVLLGGVFLGAVAVTASKLCEKLLGGYFVGGICFNGLFSILWRGNCFEFLANAIVWSFVAVYAMEALGRNLGWLREQRLGRRFRRVDCSRKARSTPPC